MATVSLALVTVHISEKSEFSIAESTLVRLFPGMATHVSQQQRVRCKRLSAYAAIGRFASGQRFHYFRNLREARLSGRRIRQFPRDFANVSFFVSLFVFQRIESFPAVLTRMTIVILVNVRVTFESRAVAE